MMLLTTTLRDRRRSWLWWAVALALTTALVVLSYSTIEGQTELEESLADIPESIKVLMGIDEELTLTSPGGYLNSQLFANMLPLLLTIFGIGIAARVIAGEEGAGRLELLLAHPVSRQRVILERGVAAGVLLKGLGLVTIAALLAVAPSVGLDGVGAADLVAAATGSLLLALLHSSVTFGVGAWTGKRGLAIAAGAAVTTAGVLVQSLANVSDGLRPLRWLSPWHWFADARPVVDGFGPLLGPAVATIVVSAVVVGLGAWRFTTRDIGAA